MTANVCTPTQPELLSRILIPQAGAYVADSAYAMERKRDGKHLLVSTVSGRACAYNKHGDPCDLPPALKGLPGAVTLDGEWERGKKFVVYDLLDCLGHDLRALPYSERVAAREMFFKAGILPPCCRLIETWFTEKEKETNLLRAAAEHWEGVVFKKLAARSIPGRAGQHVKLKFVKSCTAKITEVEPTRATLVMCERGQWVEVSGVSLIGRKRVRPGDYIEVEYIYATRERGLPKLNQPVMKDLRDDAKDSDCVTEQLVFRTEVE
jgi:hypothetical protein